MRRGWCLGARFKKELLAQMHESFGKNHGGEERDASCEAQAEGLLESETTMTLTWIAERLSMGSASTVAQCLRRKC